MNYFERRNVCHARSSLYQLSNPTKKWPKHFQPKDAEKFTPLAKLQMMDDWVEYDPRYPNQEDEPITLHIQEEE